MSRHPVLDEDVLLRNGLSRLPVVVLGSSPPAWLSEMCGATGRVLETWPDESPRDAGPLFAAPGLVRAVNQLAGRTVWVARSQNDSRPARVVAALRDLPGDSVVLAEATAAAAHLGATLTVAHAVPRSFAERSVALEEAVERGRTQLATAIRAATSRLSGGSHVHSRLVRIRPHELVGEALDADLLVIGGPRADSGDRAGLVLNCALQHAPCPVLLAPRYPPL